MVVSVETPLTAAFLERAGAWGGAADHARLEAALQAILRDAVRAHPGLGVDGASFAGYLGARIEPGDADPVALLSAVHASDLYLACACSQGNPVAAACLEREVFRVIPAFLRHIDTAPAFVDEVTQLVREKLLVARPGIPPRIVTYSGRGALTSWVGVSAQRTALSLRRRVDRSDDRAIADQLGAGSDPELEYLKAHYRQAFRGAFAGAITALTPRERVLLRLSVLQGMSLEKIGLLYQVNQSTITRWLARARTTLLRRTQRALRDQLHIGADELQSLTQMVLSDVDVSLSRLLADSDG